MVFPGRTPWLLLVRACLEAEALVFRPETGCFGKCGDDEGGAGARIPLPRSLLLILCICLSSVLSLSRREREEKVTALIGAADRCQGGLGRLFDGILSLVLVDF